MRFFSNEPNIDDSGFKLLFNHIPKTAGTSFRRALEEQFGKHDLLCDYGPKARQTSKVIKKYVYEKESLYEFKKWLDEQPRAVLVGHFNLSRYFGCFDMCNTISFVRNPAVQIVSHFNHYVNLHGYKGSFESFVMDNKFQNTQSKALSSTATYLFGILGVVEKYKLSLELINDIYSLDLKNHNLNKNDSKKVFCSRLDREMVNTIIKKNKEDYDLFRVANHLLKTRLLLKGQGLPFTYGRVQTSNNLYVQGWAYRPTGEDVSVEVYVNGFYEGTARADIFKPELYRYTSVRDGFVGFRHDFSKQVRKRDKVKCVIKGTNQKI